jgi:hypothetical protein
MVPDWLWAAIEADRRDAIARTAIDACRIVHRLRVAFPGLGRDAIVFLFAEIIHENGSTPSRLPIRLRRRHDARGVMRVAATGMSAPPSIDRFFTRYAELSMGPRPEELADLYAPTFIAGGPQGSQAFTNDARFREWLVQLGDFNRRHGMRALRVVATREQTLSPLHALATVTWGAQFDKTGDRVIEFEISYLLERAGGDWKILCYISRSDQQEDMKKEGLL